MSDPVAQLEARLLSLGQTLGVAESCTGGLVASTITDRPGASRWFCGGVVAYSVALKEHLLSVPTELVNESGVVSEAVALAMAAGVIERLDVDLAGSVTGTAGPGRDDDGNPPGTVWIAAMRRGGGQIARQLSIEGDRETIKRHASQALLVLLVELLDLDSQATSADH